MVYMKKIDNRINQIQMRIREHYFKKYNITFRSFAKGLQELIKKSMAKKENKRL